jgi:hypothetical protein
VPVLSWSPTTRRKIEHVRDRIMRGLGTDELIEEQLPDVVALADFGRMTISVSWRKPLSLAEVNQMAPTPEVRARPGRP